MAVTFIVLLLVVVALVAIPLSLRLAKKHGRRELPGRRPSAKHPIRENRSLDGRRAGAHR